VKCQRAEQESMLIHPSALRTEPITEELSRRCGILWPGSPSRLVHSILSGRRLR